MRQLVGSCFFKITLYDLEYILLSLRIRVKISEVESVAGVAEEAARAEEHNQDGGPHHEARQEPGPNIFR